MMGRLHNPLNYPTWLRGIVITGIAMGISWLVVCDLTSVSFLMPMEKAVDFRFSDFYTMVANDRAVATLDSSIVIVAVDGCNRREIAAAIDDVDFCEPKAVGLDISFSPPRDLDDDPLAHSIAECSNLVLPVVAQSVGEDEDLYEVCHLSYYDDFAPNAKFAAVNIEGEMEARSTVRDFRWRFGLTDGGYLLSLPCALVEMTDSEAAQRLYSRSCDSEEILFASRRFEVIYPDEILDVPEKIAGKIVIVGKINDVADMHSSPLANMTPGVMIHAHTAATMLGGRFVKRLTHLEDWLLSAMLCYMVVFANLLIGEKVLGPFLVRGLQVVLLYLMVVVGSACYVLLGIDLDFTNAMLMTSLGVVACELFHGLFAQGGVVARISGFFSRFRTFSFFSRFSNK